VPQIFAGTATACGHLAVAAIPSSVKLTASSVGEAP
jgi:hypothetical protein